MPYLLALELGTAPSVVGWWDGTNLILDSFLKPSLVCLGVTLSLCIACATSQGTSGQNTQRLVLKKWALARCLAKASGPSPAGDDAAKTAAAYLEQGKSDLEVYETIDALVGRYLNREYTGSVQSNYTTMKCLDLYHSDELDQLARHSVK
jgi:hypothetical protein